VKLAWPLKVGGAGACIGSCILGSGERSHQQDRSYGKKLMSHGHSIRPKSLSVAIA
jgi:hypothetical protein